VPARVLDDLLTDLDPAQREAVTITSGPLCILAGAGSGKTRVITRRVAFALAEGVVRPQDVLVVTFTDKAAGEMSTRLSALGHRGVAASTFHAAALRQLRHFWPRQHDGALPSILESKAPIMAPLAAGLPGGYRYLAVRDLAAEIEWAKARRIVPAAYEAESDRVARDGPLPGDLMARLYGRYEAAKTRAGRIDFEDMLELTIGLIEGDAAIADEVRDRYRWFSVDEFQDTNPLQAALLEAWLGGREDLAVVGDEDQTIYTFTGATSDYLAGFEARYPAARIVSLETNYRSTPEVMGFANRVLAAGRVAADERAPGSTPSARVLKAMEHVADARDAAWGNVNPQILLAVLGEELAEYRRYPPAKLRPWRRATAKTGRGPDGIDNQVGSLAGRDGLVRFTNQVDDFPA
jgi:DNA helicase-2/ATP-dependent DNA helicase PcrA